MAMFRLAWEHSARQDANVLLGNRQYLEVCPRGVASREWNEAIRGNLVRSFLRLTYGRTAASKGRSGGVVGASTQ